MAALALIRHGQYEQLEKTPSALQPYPLTDSGVAEVRAQAQAFGRWLGEAGFVVQPQIHCSTLLRAWQTAEIFREELADFFIAQPQCLSFPALCERSVGAVANLTIQEIERIVQRDPRLTPLPAGWKSNSEFRLPFDGAESLLQAGERVAAHLSTLPLSESDRSIQLIVGHGASIRHAMYHLNVINFCDIGKLSMFYGHPVVFQNNNHNWSLVYGGWKKRRTADTID